MPGEGGLNLNFGGGSTNGAVQAGDPPGAEVIDRTRNALKLLLGGWYHEQQITCCDRSTDLFPAVADTYEDHPHYVDFTVNWTRLKGDEGDQVTVDVVVDCKCENAATTITPRIVIAGTSTVNVTGSAHSTTSWAAQTLTLVSSTGVVSYRLQIKRSDLTYAVRSIARRRLYA